MNLSNWQNIVRDSKRKVDGNVDESHPNVDRKKLKPSEPANKISCWDKMDYQWERNTKQCEGNRIYVHGHILEWVIEIFDRTILNLDTRGTVEEIHHHNLDGPVCCIRFYIHKKNSHEHIQNYLFKIKNILKFKMPWKSLPTYFLRMDSNFENVKKTIMDELKQELNLNPCECIKVSQSVINWAYKKIEIYEFRHDLTAEQIELIDVVFQNKCLSRASIYVCDQFSWHRDMEKENFIEMDTLAMDICAEEWSRHNLLEDFPLDDIFVLELANKDFRNAYLNSYLERYLNRRLQTIIPELCPDNYEKIMVPLLEYDENKAHEYFVSKYYDRISAFLYWRHGPKLRINLNSLHQYDIPVVETNAVKFHINSDQTVSNLTKLSNAQIIEYTISNSRHFGGSFFCELLNLSNAVQIYSIDFSNDFTFTYDNNDTLEEHVKHNRNLAFLFKSITIELVRCSEEIFNKLENFVKYLIKLFSKRRKLNDVSLRFKECAIDDFSFLENIEQSINSISFTEMIITPGHVLSLGRYLSKMGSINFDNCDCLTDENVMALLENIHANCLRIEGSNSCTYFLYFLLAQHLMEQENITTITFDEIFLILPCIENNSIDLNEIYFENIGDKLVAKHQNSNHEVDLFYLINNINPVDDEPIEIVVPGLQTLHRLHISDSYIN